MSIGPYNESQRVSWHMTCEGNLSWSLNFSTTDLSKETTGRYGQIKLSPLPSMQFQKVICPLIRRYSQVKGKKKATDVHWSQNEDMEWILRVSDIIAFRCIFSSKLRWLTTFIMAYGCRSSYRDLSVHKQLIKVVMCLVCAHLSMRYTNL